MRNYKHITMSKKDKQGRRVFECQCCGAVHLSEPKDITTNIAWLLVHSKCKNEPAI